MKFTEYANKADRLARKNGTELEGQPVSAAPGGGQWVFVPTDRRYHKVRTRLGAAESLAEDTFGRSR